MQCIAKVFLARSYWCNWNADIFGLGHEEFMVFFDVYVFVFPSNSLPRRVSDMCISIFYKRYSWQRDETCVSNSNRWCSELFTYMYMYWIPKSIHKTKGCACISSCWDGCGTDTALHCQHKVFAKMSFLLFIVMWSFPRTRVDTILAQMITDDKSRHVISHLLS